MGITFIVPAAGSGQRFGEAKQFRRHKGLSLLHWSVLALVEACPHLKQVVVALPAEAEAEVEEIRQRVQVKLITCRGGASRQESVYRAMECLVEQGDWQQDLWLIHDAARPLVKKENLQELIRVIEESGEGGLLASPCRDTLKRSQEDGCVGATADRRQFWLAQTPQGAPSVRLWEANQAVKARWSELTDDASILEAAGVPVHLVESSFWNIKITESEDWRIFAALRP